MKLAPIVLFVYNRPRHAEQTLEALSINELANESSLYIYADGPRQNASVGQQNKISEVRKVIRKKQWCKEITIVESSTNKGLADSIIEGVTEIVNKFGKVIVLEDDVVPSSGFLKYMNDALNLYEFEDKVMQVSAYIYPSSKILKNVLFLKIMACWGWATWARAWKHYNHDINEHLKHFKSNAEIKKFNIEGHASFYWQLLANKENEIYTWAVRWYASWLYSGGISLFPSSSLVQNIGFDNSGENCTTKSDLNYSLTDKLIVTKEPIIENYKIRMSIDKYLKKRTSDNTLIIKKIKKIFIIKKSIALLKRIRLIFSKELNWNVIRNIQFKSKIDDKANIQPTYHIFNSTIERYSYVAKNSEIRNTTVGKFCSIGQNFISGNGIHPLNTLSTSPMFYSNAKQNGTSLTGKNKVEEFLPVIVGNDVFIGDNVTVLSGIVIGDGAVIGAGAVVSKDIPPYAIAVGCPIKILRYRFSENQREALLRIKWWDFSDEKLIFVEQDLFTIDAFIEKYDK